MARSLKPRFHLAPALLAMACLFAAQGCGLSMPFDDFFGGSTTTMRIARVGARPMQMDPNFTTVVAVDDPLVEASIWLTDIPLDALRDGTVQDGQILHVELLFRPRPGYTPLDPTATNLSIRYIVCSRGEVGIYQGGGFGYPQGTLEDTSMRISIESASMSLGAHTKGFLDLLTPASLSGTVHGPRNDAVGIAIRNGADALVTTAFGRGMWVDGGDGTTTAHPVENDNRPDMLAGRLEIQGVVEGVSPGS
jgi:hypothetical protein